MVVGIASKTHVVLAAIKVAIRSLHISTHLTSSESPPIPARKLLTNTLTLSQRNAEDLSSYQKKIIPIDTHYGLALAGLASDARVLSNYMKQQSLASRLTLARPIPLSHILSQLGSRAQSNTQHYGRRPYGVGLLVAGADGSGTHLYEFNPSGVTTEMVADAIGARSQMARTYLERHLDVFEGCGREELGKHALKALRESLPADKELGIENTSLALGGVGEKFVLLEGEDVRSWLNGAFEKGENEGAAADEGGDAPAAATDAPAEGESMEVDS